MVTATAWMEPDYDLRPLIREYIKAVGDELNFNNEAQNQMRAAKAMDQFRKERPEHNVVVPTIYPEWTTQRMLVMEFCPGFKVTEVSERGRETPPETHTKLPTDENVDFATPHILPPPTTTPPISAPSYNSWANTICADMPDTHPE